MQTLKGIARLAAAIFLAVAGLLLVFVVVGNVLNWAWLKHLDGKPVVSHGYVKTITMDLPNSVHSTTPAVQTVDSLPPSK